MLLGVFCMTTQLIFKIGKRVKNILPFTLTSLVVLSLLTISNIFVTNQVEANHNNKYISMKWEDERMKSGATEQSGHEKTLRLKNNTTDHPNFPGEFRIDRSDMDSWTAQVKWYLNGNMQGQSAVFNQARELIIPSPYGTWRIDLPDVPAPGQPNNLTPGYEDYLPTDGLDNRFEPNDVAINSLPPGSNAKVVLDLELVRDLSHLNRPNHFDATLFIEHNTSATWDSNSSPNLFEVTSSSTINDNPDATIKTFHTPTSELSFTSKLYNGTALVDTRTLTENSGTWTHSTTYGDWVISNETTCGDAKCFDVEFRKDATAFMSISDKNIIAELEITITSASNTIETDTLTYFLNIPTFSISAVSDSVNEGGMAQFKVTSDVNPGTDTYSVRFAPTNTVGDYLDVSAGASGIPRSESITFQANTIMGGGTEYSNTFPVNMREIDNANTATGTVTVELYPIADAGGNKLYAVASAPNNSATVSVEDQNTPQLTISNAPDIVAGQNALFPITATPHPLGDELTIRIIPTETGSSFLEPDNGKMSGDERTPTITFQKQGDGTGTGTISIPTQIDNSSTIGVLKLQLLADSNTSDPSYTITGKYSHVIPKLWHLHRIRSEQFQLKKIQLLLRKEIPIQ